MNLLNTLYELEIELNRNQSAREAFAKKMQDNGILKQNIPNLEEVARSHSQHLKEKQLQRLFGKHIRSPKKSSDQYENRSFLNAMASTPAKKRTLGGKEYSPISQSLMSIFERINESIKNIQSRLASKTKPPLFNKLKNTQQIRLRSLRTSSDLRFKMKRKDAQRADRLAKRVNLMKNSRSDAQSIKKELDDIAISDGFRGSAIRKIRPR